MDWFDVAGLEEVSDVMEGKTDVSAFGWDLWRLDKFDCRYVVCEHLGWLGWCEAEVSVEVSEVHDLLGAPRHGDVLALQWAEGYA